MQLPLIFEGNNHLTRKHSAWEQRKLGDCLLVQRGGSPRPIDDYITDDPKGINWIKIGDVAPGSRYITNTAEKIKPEGEAKSRRVYVGDLVLSNSMSFGRPYILQVEGCIHDGWLVIRDEEELFDTEFLQQLLSTSEMYEQYRALAAGGVVNNLNSELVQSALIVVPSLPEQRAIGALFARLDSLITLHQRQAEPPGTHANMFSAHQHGRPHYPKGRPWKLARARPTCSATITHSGSKCTRTGQFAASP